MYNVEKYRVEMANLSAIKNDNNSYYNNIAFNIYLDDLNLLPDLIKDGYLHLQLVESDNPKEDNLWDFEAYTLTKLELIGE